jgi:outer membrane protein assembly factor BamB
MGLLDGYTFKKRHALLAVIVAAAAWYVSATVPFGVHVHAPADTTLLEEGQFFYEIPLDRESPWPKFRANALQNGRSPVDPKVDDSLRPWTFETGKGIFSSPVVGGNGTVYIGSADHVFYAIRAEGTLEWKFATGEVIDSSALLDNRGRVYFGSGDGHVYGLDRQSGELLWKSAAHSVEEVQKQFGLKTYNVNWFEGNIAMLADGTLIAPNDNYLVYEIDRDSGRRKTQYIANEMVWSLPAVNTSTQRIFFGSQYVALKNVFCYDAETGARRWKSGGLGSNAASPLLTSGAENGVVVIGGYDGYVRAYAQDSGKQLWKRGLRGHIYASPGQLSDGTIIQPCADGTVYALEASSGNVKWTYDILEPLRSSPAIDAKDRIYVGGGDGRLYCINADGTRRWSYLCIDGKRNDLNSSPALGERGVYIGGENGGVFFVPYDYPLTAEGKKDPRCSLGAGEKLPPDGVFMLYTEPFGGLSADPPDTIEANQPLSFTLAVRRSGETVKAAIEPESFRVSISGDPARRVDVSADRQFVTITPQETWTGPAGAKITVELEGEFIEDMWRLGLKFFWGHIGGSFQKHYTFHVPARSSAALPYEAPSGPGALSTVFELSRLSAPNPTMLPSWNQIGFDSLHYLAGVVEEGREEAMLLWVIGGKLKDGETIVAPSLDVRFPLSLTCDRGLLTFHNYDGFKTNFIGSWDMPFGLWRIAAKAEAGSGRILHTPAFTAVALGDEIEFYGTFLKLMGMTDWRTGRMLVFGGMDLELRGKGYAARPHGIGGVSFSSSDTETVAKLEDSSLQKKEHVYSLLLVDEASGKALPLYYTKNTAVSASEDGSVNAVSVSYDKGEVEGSVKAYLMVDTYPVAAGFIR